MSTTFGKEREPGVFIWSTTKTCLHHQPSSVQPAFLKPPTLAGTIGDTPPQKGKCLNGGSRLYTKKHMERSATLEYMEITNEVF